MSTPNPFVQAGAPELVAALKAIQTFLAQMGTDPAQWVAKFVPAQTVLVGTLGLQVPALAQAEAGALSAAANSQIAKWISDLEAKTKP